MANGLNKSFIFNDHLGSLDVVTNEAGVVTHSASFDAWGQRRNPETWATGNFPASTSLLIAGFTQPLTQRGYTGHEHLDDMGLIHMNGRVYDPRLARFLQADPFIQAAANTQSYNRYSYVINNPLNATDPSGYFWETVAVMFASYVIGSLAADSGWQWLSALAQMVACGTGNYAYCMASAFGSTYGATGSLEMAIKASAIAGFSQAVFTGIGEGFGGTSLEGGIAHIAAHGVAGGVISVLQGGKFGHGFASAAFSKAFMTHYNFDYRKGGIHIAGRTAIAALVGGTISKATGGKFANGAVTSAMAHLFNAEKSAAERRSACSGRPCTSRGDGKKFAVGISGAATHPGASVLSTVMNLVLDDPVAPSGISGGIWVNAQGPGGANAEYGFDYDFGLGAKYVGSIDVIEVGAQPTGELSLVYGLGVRIYYDDSMNYVGHGYAFGIGASIFTKFFSPKALNMQMGAEHLRKSHSWEW